ncbi:MAG: hypothetical protein MUC50_19245 [Myxococcota bacterium]|jgi:hypothetical protein|nr:hypothetical protein [Myxococcota bacterium]
MARKKIEPWNAPNRQPWEIPLGGGEFGIDVEVYFSLLEEEIGYDIIACDVEEDNVVHGHELLDRLADDDSAPIQPEQAEVPILSEEHERRIKEAEEELGYRLVCYHAPSNGVVWSWPLLDEMAAREGNG